MFDKERCFTEVLPYSAKCLFELGGVALDRRGMRVASATGLTTGIRRSDNSSSFVYDSLPVEEVSFFSNN